MKLNSFWYREYFIHKSRAIVEYYNNVTLEKSDNQVGERDWFNK